MASLDQHVREPGDHARLGYRADCAVCRLERQNPHLPEGKMRSMRAQATAFALLLGATGAGAGAPPPVDPGQAIPPTDRGAVDPLPHDAGAVAPPASQPAPPPPDDDA